MSKENVLVPWLSAALALAFSLNVAATETTSLETLRTLAEDHVRAQLTTPDGGRLVVQANALDKRLRYPRCHTPLEASQPGGKGNGRYITVQIRCPDPDGFSLYVPVQIRHQLPVVVATSALAVGTLLDDTVLKVEYRDASGLRGEHYAELAPLDGAKLTRRVNPGQPLRRKNVCLVCKGDDVTIEANLSSMAIKTKGEALSNGGLGDRIRVQNRRSERIIEAKVMGVGVVAVQL